MANSTSPADFAAGAAPAASSIGQLGLNVVGDQISQKTQAKYYKENQDYLLGSQMKAARQTYQNAVASLGEAGLNPAIAANASGMTVGAAPHPTPSGHSVDAPNPEFALMGSKSSLMKKQEEQIDSGIELNKSGITKNLADASKAEEETRGIELQNDAFKSKQDTLGVMSLEYLHNLADIAEEMGDKPRAKMLGSYFAFLQHNKQAYFDSGALDAIDLLNASLVKESDKYLKVADNILMGHVSDLRREDQKVIQAMVKLPQVQRQELYSRINETNKRIALLAEQTKGMIAQTEHTEADTKLIEENAKKTRAEIVKIGRESAAILHNDPNQMYDEGEYFALGTYILGRGVDIAAQFGSSYLGGRAFGAGMSAGRVPAPAPAKPSLILPPTPSNMNKMYREHGGYFEHH